MSRKSARRQDASYDTPFGQIEERVPKSRVRLSDLIAVEPITETQEEFFTCYRKGTPAFLLHGVAGTGKTFIALYHALREVLREDTPYERVVIVRSAVPSRDMGHLPGDYAEKSEVYTQPYVEMLAHMLPRHGELAFNRLSNEGKLLFMVTSYVRGLTLDNAIVIVDECQNLNFGELNSIITRVGHETKIVFCGDFRQTDLQGKWDTSGLSKFTVIIGHMPSFRKIEFGTEDVVRSGLCKEWILAQLQFEDFHQN